MDSSSLHFGPVCLLKLISFLLFLIFPSHWAILYFLDTVYLSAFVHGLKCLPSHNLAVEISSILEYLARVMLMAIEQPLLTTPSKSNLFLSHVMPCDIYFIILSHSDFMIFLYNLKNYIISNLLVCKFFEDRFYVKFIFVYSWQPSYNDINILEAQLYF